MLVVDQETLCMENFFSPIFMSGGTLLQLSNGLESLGIEQDLTSCSTFSPFQPTIHPCAKLESELDALFTFDECDQLGLDCFMFSFAALSETTTEEKIMQSFASWVLANTATGYGTPFEVEDNFRVNTYTPTPTTASPAARRDSIWSMSDKDRVVVKKLSASREGSPLQKRVRSESSRKLLDPLVKDSKMREYEKQRSSPSRGILKTVSTRKMTIIDSEPPVIPEVNLTPSTTSLPATIATSIPSTLPSSSTVTTPQASQKDEESLNRNQTAKKVKSLNELGALTELLGFNVTVPLLGTDSLTGSFKKDSDDLDGLFKKPNDDLPGSSHKPLPSNVSPMSSFVSSGSSESLEVTKKPSNDFVHLKSTSGSSPDLSTIVRKTKQLPSLPPKKKKVPLGAKSDDESLSPLKADGRRPSNEIISSKLEQQKANSGVPPKPEKIKSEESQVQKAPESFSNDALARALSDPGSLNKPAPIKKKKPRTAKNDSSGSLEIGSNTPPIKILERKKTTPKISSGSTTPISLITSSDSSTPISGSYSDSSTFHPESPPPSESRAIFSPRRKKADVSTTIDSISSASAGSSPRPPQGTSLVPPLLESLHSSLITSLSLPEITTSAVDGNDALSNSEPVPLNRTPFEEQSSESSAGSCSAMTPTSMPGRLDSHSKGFIRNNRRTSDSKRKLHSEVDEVFAHSSATTSVFQSTVLLDGQISTDPLSRRFKPNTLMLDVASTEVSPNSLDPLTRRFKTSGIGGAPRGARRSAFLFDDTTSLIPKGFAQATPEKK